MRLFSSQSDTVELPSTLSGVSSIFGPFFFDTEIDGLYYDLPGFFFNTDDTASISVSD